MRRLTGICTALALAMMVAPLSDAATLRPVVIEAATTDRTVTAGQDETVDILFGDGTSVILSPGASLTIGQYSFNPATGSGRLTLQLNSGRARISGGRLNEADAILIETPEATIGLDAGAAMVATLRGETRAYLLNGRGLQVSSDGDLENLFRPEFGVAADRSGVSEPERVDPVLVAADLDAFSQGGELVLAMPAEPEMPVRPTTSAPSRKPPSGQTGAPQPGESSEAARPDSPSSEIVCPEHMEDLQPSDALVESCPSLNDERPDLADLNTNSAPTPSAPTDVSFDVGFILGVGGPAHEPSIGRGPAEVNAKNSTIRDPNFVRTLQQLRREISSENSAMVREFDDFYPIDFGPTTNKVFQSPLLTEPITSGLPSSYASNQGGLSYGISDDGAFAIRIAADQMLNDIRGLFLFPDPGAGRSSEETFVQPLVSEPDADRIGTGFEEDVVDKPDKVIGAFVETLKYSDPGGSFFYAELTPASVVFEDQFSENFTPRPEDQRRLVFAAGDVSGAKTRSEMLNTTTVHEFHISPGLTPTLLFNALELQNSSGSDVASGQRAFVRGESWTGLDDGLSAIRLTDTGLFVVNPADNPLQVGAPLLHADFGLGQTGGRQVSTISVTVGELSYRETSYEGQPELPAFEDEFIGEVEAIPAVPAFSRVHAVASARTVASSRGNGTTLISGPVISTAAGGGNPLLPTGYAGFLFFENAGAVFDTKMTDFVRDETISPDDSQLQWRAPAPSVLPGGIERPLGTEGANVSFAIGRLAIATGTASVSRTFKATTSLSGYAAGLTEVETAAGITLKPFADPKSGPNFEMNEFDLSANVFRARIAGNSGTVSLGGPGASAWVDDRTFGARTPDAISTQAVALVSGDSGDSVPVGSGDPNDSGDTIPIASELAGVFTGSDGETLRFKRADGSFSDTPGGYDHVKWGFFFGDLVTKEGEREHMHLGSFVAGPPVDSADLFNASGTAAYSGHAIGDVYDGGDLRTVAGTFDETFNFKSKTGTTTLDFDGRNFTNPAGTTSTLAGQEYRSRVASGDIAGDLRGRFTGKEASSGVSPAGTEPPAGLIGGFTLQNSSASPDTSYRAIGTFAGSAEKAK